MTTRTASEILSGYPVPVERLISDREARTKSLMEVHKLDALVAFSGATLANRGNVRWFTNYFSPDLSCAAVFTGRAPTVLLVPYVVELYWAEQLAWVEDVRLADDYVAEASRVLRELNCASGRIGLVGEENMAPDFVRQLQQSLPEAHTISISDAFRQMRLHKSDDEVSLTRSASRVADTAFRELTRIIKPGITEREIVSEAQRLLVAHGAEFTFIAISSTSAVIKTLPSPRRLQAGDILQLSLELAGPGGYWIQMIRSFCIAKEPTPEAAKAFEGVKTSIQAATEALRPGARLGDVAQHAKDVIDRYARELDAKRSIPFGHGMGLDLAEGFLLAPANEIIAEPNMIVVIHPSIYTSQFGVIAGDTFVVKQDGAESLGTFPYELTRI